jgi:uncharacterized membrane protein
MNGASRISAALAYIPVIGWLYVLALQRQNALAVFHVRQSIGLVIFLIAALVIWAAIAFVLAWIPMISALGVALFAMVMVAWFYGAVALVMGIINALNGKQEMLPGFGRRADRLPIR